MPQPSHKERPDLPPRQHPARVAALEPSAVVVDDARVEHVAAELTAERVLIHEHIPPVLVPSGRKFQ